MSHKVEYKYEIEYNEFSSKWIVSQFIKKNVADDILGNWNWFFNELIEKDLRQECYAWIEAQEKENEQ
jgi:hypothetical protein